MRWSCTVMALSVAFSATAAEPVLKVPAGFEIAKVAGTPLVRFPVVAEFDDKGRLYVVDVAGPLVREEVAQQKPLHRVVRLEDTDGDGTFDKAVTFADKLPFPEGIMWLDGSIYVGCPPSIWKLTDTDGDGVADERKIWFDGKTLTGCANDLHGPYRGPDGFIYWTKGAFAKQDHTLGNGKKFSTRASHVFRAKPDGSALEVVMTGGMDNPVGIAFSATGEIIVSNTFLQHPADGKRDGLIHAVPGGVWGKDHDPIYEHPWTSPNLMPVMTHMGPAAPSGIRRYESAQFGLEYRDNLFCSQFNLRKISRHILVPKGSTYETKDSDFVTSDSTDFHPTDVVEAADGSLLVIDTGGWYKLCCPSSQLVKDDVFGAIYRVKKTGSHKVEDARGERIDWKNLPEEKALELLTDSRPAVVQKTIRWFANRGKASVGILQSIRAVPSLPPYHQPAMLNGLWALAQIDDPTAELAISSYVESFSNDVRIVATRLIGLRRTKDARTLLRLENRLPSTGPDPHWHRAIAETLGRSGSPNVLEAFYQELSNERIPDRHRDNAIVHAMIEIGDVAELVRLFDFPTTARGRRCALMALENIDAKQLKAAKVLPHLSATDADLRETAWWIAARHTDWGTELVGYFRERLAAKQTPAEAEELTNRLAQFAKNPAIQELLSDDPLNVIALKAMARSGIKTVPVPWPATLALSLACDSTRPAALATIRALPMKSLPEPLAKALQLVGGNPMLAADLRLGALAILNAPLSDDHFAFVLAGLQGDHRGSAAEVLTRVPLTTPQFLKVASVVSAASPLELGKLLLPFAKSTDEAVGLALVVALHEPKVMASIRTEQLKPILEKYPAKVKTEAAKLYALLDAEILKQREKLEMLAKELPVGDLRRGHHVFNSAKAACATCHTIGYVGGTIGPDMTRIGSIRTERDLLEAIVYPSASFVRSYEPVKVTTKDGNVHNGILKKDAPDEIVLVLAADKEVRIPRSEIDEFRMGTVSIMPAGLDQQLTKQDLADLIAFLRANK